ENRGGKHVLGERADPRLAWSEGWATFFAQAVLGTPVAIRTLGPGKGWDLDLEEDAPEWDDPGYWSEVSVASALWDIFADTGSGSGHLGLGLKPIWKVFRDHLPEQAFHYLVTMADGLIQQDRHLDGGVTGVLANREIEYHFGVVPPVSVPFPRLISPGA